MASGLSLKSYRPKWLTTTLSSCSAQKIQVDGERKNMGKSNMFKENIIKERVESLSNIESGQVGNTEWSQVPMSKNQSPIHKFLGLPCQLESGFYSHQVDTSSLFLPRQFFQISFGKCIHCTPLHSLIQEDICRRPIEIDKKIYYELRFDLNWIFH